MISLVAFVLILIVSIKVLHVVVTLHQSAVAVVPSVANATALTRVATVVQEAKMTLVLGWATLFLTTFVCTFIQLHSLGLVPSVYSIFVIELAIEILHNFVVLDVSCSSLEV